MKQSLFVTIAGLLFSVSVISAGRDCWYGGRGYGGGTLWRVSQPRCRLGAASNSSLDSGTLNGRVADVVYLSRCRAGRTMVEIVLDYDHQSTRVRLGPVEYLIQNALLPKEGDSVSVNGFTGNCAAGDVVVATEIRKGDHRVILRDSQGRPAW